MKRSPVPLSRRPPAPRRPSSRSAPVMSNFGTNGPVGWNCTISMARRRTPALRASAMPSAALSAEHAMTLYIVGPPPMASSVARARTARKPPRRMSRRRAPPARPAPSRRSSTARCSSRTRIDGRVHTCSVRRFMISMPVRSPLLIVRSREWSAKPRSSPALSRVVQQGLLLDVDGEDGELPVAPLALHLLHPGGKLVGATGGGRDPEVPHDHLAGEVGQRDPPAVEAKQREGGRLAPDERVEPSLLDELVELGLLPGPVALPILPVEVIEPGRDLPLDVSIPRLLALALVLVVDLRRGLWDADARGDRHEGKGRPERASPHEGLTSTVPSKREPA